MKIQQCPKCKNECPVSTKSIELGVLIKCKCGCEFEYLPKELDELVEFWNNEPKSSSGNPADQEVFSYQAVNSAAPYIISWIPHLSLIIVWLLISSVLGLSWITILLFVSFILTSFCFKNRKAKKQINENSVGFFFFDKCCEFFVCFSLVLCFYAGLSWLVEGTSDTTTLSRLESLEQFLIKIKDFVSYLKIKPWYAALIIFGLIIIDLLVSYFIFSKYVKSPEGADADGEQNQSTLASRYKFYHTWSKRIYIVAVLLCSFTFFGNSVTGERVARLRLNIDKIRDGYEKLKEEAEESLMASVQQKIYEKVKESLPSDVKNDFDYPHIINMNLSELYSYNEQLKKYGISNPDFEATVKDYDAQVKRNANIPNEPVNYEEPKAKDVKTKEPKPKDIKTEKPVDSKAKAAATVKSVEKSVAEVKTKKSFRVRFVSLLKLEGTKELLVKFPGSLTDVTKSKIFGEIVKTHPILEPIVDVFVGTMDKHVEAKVKDSAVIVADALLESPEKAERILIDESKKIADSVEIKKNESAVEKIRRFYADIKVRLSKIKEINQKAQLLVEEKKPKPPVVPKSDSTSGSNEQDQLIPCYCTCTRNPGVPIFRGNMTYAQCKLSCTGPC